VCGAVVEEVIREREIAGSNPTGTNIARKIPRLATLTGWTGC
jgi:hypothetical protein